MKRAADRGEADPAARTPERPDGDGAARRESRSAPGARRRRGGSFRLVMLLLAAVLVATAAAAVWLILDPALLRPAAERLAAAVTGRPVSIGALDLRREGGGVLIAVRDVRIGSTTVERVRVSLAGADPRLEGSGVRLPSGSSIEHFRASLELALAVRPALPTVEASGVVLVVTRRDPAQSPRPPPFDRLLVLPRNLLRFGLERLTLHSGKIRYRSRGSHHSGRFTAVLEAANGGLDARGELTVAPSSIPLPFAGTVRSPFAEDWRIELRLDGDRVSMDEVRNLVAVLAPPPAMKAALDRIAGETTFRLSGRLASSRVDRIDLDFAFGPKDAAPGGDAPGIGLEGLRFVARAVPAHDLSRWTVDGEVDWSRLPGGDDAERSPFAAGWAAGAADSFRLSAERIPIPPLAALAGRALPSGRPLRIDLEGLNPTGAIAELAISGADGESAPFRLAAAVSGFGATAGAVRIDDADARLAFDGEELRVRISDDRVAVAAPSIWSASRRFTVGGEVRVGARGGRWTVRTPDLRIELAGITGRLEAKLTAPLRNEGEAPRLEAELRLSETALVGLGAVLPDLRAAKFTRWYRRVVRAGRLRGAVLMVRGDPRRFPFAAGGGALEGRATVEGAELAYAEGWPPVRTARAVLRLDGPRFELLDGRGAMFDTAIAADPIRIDDLTKPEGRIRMSLTGSGPAGDLLAFFRESPLGARAGGGGVPAADVRAEGAASTTLALDLPYGGAAAEGPPGVSGKIALDGAAFRLADRSAALEEVRGTLAFDAGRLAGGPLPGRFRGEAITSHVEFTPENGLRLRFAGAGGRDWFAAALEDLANLGAEDTAPWLSGLDGRTAWNAEYDSRNGLGFHSDLRGASLRLPPPFGKPADAERALEVFLAPGEREWMVDARYGHGVRGTFEIAEADGAWALARGGVAIGGARPTLPAGGHVVVSGRLPEIDLDTWIEGMSGEPESEGGWRSRIGRIELETAAARLLGRRLVLRKLELTPVGALGSRIELAGEGVAGELLIPDDTASGRASVHLERLHLGEPVERTPSGGGAADRGEDPATGADAGRPDSWPSFDLRIDSLRWGRLDLGGVRAVGERVADGLEIRALHVDSPNLRVNGGGSWRLDPEGTPRSRFRARMSVRHLSRLLAAAESGESTSPAGGAIEARLDLAWAGSPADPVLERMEGELALQASDGNLPSVPVGAAGRLIALLNLDALRRVLTLDLSHVFGEGLAYDRIVARASLAGGVAEIQEFTITGPAATIEMTGVIDLAARRYDEEISIIPRVTRSGALLPIWTAAWPLLVGNFLLEKASGDRPLLDRVFRLRYRLRGSWDDPELVRIGAREPQDGGGRASG